MSDSAFQAHQFLRSRRSVRRFQERPVPEALLRRVLETGTWAPSAHNRQPWRFAVLTGPAEKARLAEKMGAAFRRDLEADGLPESQIQLLVERSHRRIAGAPAVVVLCLTTLEMDVYPDVKRRRAEFRMALQSAALAGGQILLAAHGEGLGGVWVCAPLFAPGEVSAALGLPEDWEPQAMLLLGYPETIPPPRTRKSLEEIARFLSTAGPEHD